MAFVRTAGWFAFVAALAFLAYMAFAGSLSSQEFLLGAAFALFCALVTLLTWKAMGLSAKVRCIDVIQAWRIPWYFANDAGEIVLVLFRDLLHIKRAGSHFRAVRFERRRGALGTMRRVLATAYTTVTPNFLVVGIDTEQGWMIFHQLQRNSVPIMTQKLGAQK